MKEIKSTLWHYSLACRMEAAKIPAGVINEQSHELGMSKAEPLILALDAALEYAEAYHARFESRLVDDGVLGDHWLQWVKGIKGLLNGDGAVAMRMNRTTDSKDNGAVEGLFWRAMEASGFTESDL